jgi:dihydroorotate dehydrogenase
MNAVTPLSDLWLMNAAGMVKTVEDMKPLLRSSVTHIIFGGTTVERRAGNPEPTFYVTPDGRRGYNARGLPNRGLSYYVDDNLDTMCSLAQQHGKKLVWNYSSSLGFNDWATIARVAALFPEVILEINISCPNKWHDGVNEAVIAENPEAVAAILDAVHESAPHNEIWVKLPPYRNPRTNPVLRCICDIVSVRPFVKAIVSCNTIGGQKPPIVDGKPAISMPMCGMSGAPLKPWSLLQNRVIGELAPGIPRIGVGGIRAGRDIEDYRLAGVRGVAIGTEFFKTMQPRIFSDVLAEAAEYV